eukprot:COSAG01_NODE_52487_length_346_cov_0.943320_1_plen_115_part_11
MGAPISGTPSSHPVITLLSELQMVKRLRAEARDYTGAQELHTHVLALKTLHEKVNAAERHEHGLAAKRQYADAQRLATQRHALEQELSTAVDAASCSLGLRKRTAGRCPRELHPD